MEKKLYGKRTRWKEINLYEKLNELVDKNLTVIEVIPAPPKGYVIEISGTKYRYVKKEENKEES